MVTLKHYAKRLALLVATSFLAAMAYGYYLYGALGLMFMATALVEGTTITPIASLPSPDQHWTAKVNYEDYPSMFSIPAYAVTLEPAGWLGHGSEHRIAVFDDRNYGPPTLHWKTNTELYIDAKDNDVRQEIIYRNIRISINQP